MTEEAGRYAGSENFMLEKGESQGFWNAPKEFASGSDQPIEYLARTEISEAEIARTTRIFVLRSRRIHGHSNMAGAIMWKYNARMGKDRRRTQEIIHMVVGQSEGMMDRIKARFGSGGRDINRSEIQPTQARP